MGSILAYSEPMLKTSQPQRLWMPTPPSVNELFRDAGYGTDSKTGGRIRSQEYGAWISRATQELMLQKPRQHEGKVTLDFFHGMRSPLADASNYLKASEDLLVSLGILESDNAKVVQRVSSCWVPNYIGTVVHIFPFDESAPPYLGFDSGVLGQVGASAIGKFIKSPQSLGKARRATTGAAWASGAGAKNKKK
jgi:hypothetical protein